MKQLICLLLLISLFACESSPSKPNKKLKDIFVYESEETSESELMDRIPLEQKRYNQKGQLIFEMFGGESGSEYTYDSKGRKVKDVSIMHSQRSSVSKFRYLDNDSLSKIDVFTPDEKLKFTIHVVYNKAGQNDKDLCVNADGSVKFWDEYTYNKNGNISKWLRYNPDSTLQSKVVYEYDQQGREIKNTCSGELGGTYCSKYNEKGLKIEETAYNTDDKLFLWLKVYSYDESGRITKIVEYNDPKHRPKNPYRISNYEYTFW